MSSIHEYVRNGNVSEVQTFIATGGDINAVDKLSRTALHLAGWAAQAEIMQLLLRAKADVEKKAMDGFTVLHFAVQSNGPEAARCVSLLVQKAKRLLYQRTTKGSKLPLHLAVSKGNEDVVKVLLEVGADPEVKTGTGQTSFDLAKTDAMRQLLTDWQRSKQERVSQKKRDKAGDDEEKDVIEAEEHSSEEEEEEPVAGSKRKRSNENEAEG